MGRDTRGNQAPSATIIHHISNEGTRRMSCSLRIFFDVVGNVTFPGSCMLRAKDLPPAKDGTGHQEEPGTIGKDHPSIISIRGHQGRMGCSQWFFFDVVGMLRSLVRVCSDLWIFYGRQQMGRDTRKKRVSSAMIIHPSIMRAPGRTSCSPRFFFDVMGSVAFPGLRAAQTYGFFTAGNKWDGTPGETGHHRQ